MFIIFLCSLIFWYFLKVLPSILYISKKLKLLRTCSINKKKVNITEHKTVKVIKHIKLNYRTCEITKQIEIMHVEEANRCWG